MSTKTALLTLAFLGVCSAFENKPKCGTGWYPHTCWAVCGENEPIWGYYQVVGYEDWWCWTDNSITCYSDADCAGATTCSGSCAAGVSTQRASILMMRN